MRVEVLAADLGEQLALGALRGARGASRLRAAPLGSGDHGLLRAPGPERADGGAGSGVPPPGPRGHRAFSCILCDIVNIFVDTTSTFTESLEMLPTSSVIDSRSVKSMKKLPPKGIRQDPKIN